MTSYFFSPNQIDSEYKFLHLIVTHTFSGVNEKNEKLSRISGECCSLYFFISQNFGKFPVKDDFELPFG